MRLGDVVLDEYVYNDGTGPQPYGPYPISDVFLVVDWALDFVVPPGTNDVTYYARDLSGNSTEQTVRLQAATVPTRPTPSARVTGPRQILVSNLLSSDFKGGTPVKAAGAGKVAYRGWKSGYGNVVIIEHANKYSTLYGHLSSFSKIRQGARVEQGQSIGYVGMTGLATAPHLHYEFRLNGVHRDPLSIELPKSDPLGPVELARFHRTSAPMLAQLELLGQRGAAVASR